MKLCILEASPLICPLANECVCEVLKVPVFVGQVFFMLIRNLDLQRGVSEKEIFKKTLRRWTNKLYGSRNALWATGLIIDSVHFLTEKSTHFIKWVRAAQLMISAGRKVKQPRSYSDVTKKCNLCSQKK